MTEILCEKDERVYAANTKRYQLHWENTTHYEGEGTKYGVYASVWEGGQWRHIICIYRKTKKEAFDAGKAFLVAFHDGE